MKHIQEITYGQKVQLYKMSDGFIKRVNDRMDEEIKKKTFIDATDSLSAKIRKEYRDILKQYSKRHGLKMYALLEDLIKKNCTKIILYSNQS